MQPFIKYSSANDVSRLGSTSSKDMATVFSFRQADQSASSCCLVVPLFENFTSLTVEKVPGYLHALKDTKINKMKGDRPIILPSGGFQGDSEQAFAVALAVSC